MSVIAADPRRHDALATPARGRNRSASEACPVSYDNDTPGDAPDLPRAASYTYFPKVKDLGEEPAVFEIKRPSSEDEFKSSNSNGDEGSDTSSGASSPASEKPPPTEQIPQPHKTESRRSRFIPMRSKSREPSQEPKIEKKAAESNKAAGQTKSMSPRRSLTMLRRKSWISTSRSSSPTKEGDRAAKGGESRKNSMSSERAKRKGFNVAVSIPEKSGTNDATESPSTPSTPRSRVLTKKGKRPLSGLFNSTNAQQASPVAAKAPPIPAIPKSFSTDRLPSITHHTQSPTSPTHIPPLPRNLSSEKLKGHRTEPRKKDELWTVFRTLEADLRKFQSKSIALKANVVRTTLLPFLRSYATHPSNHRLRPEDVDRRANILNGWWTGLLELLAGRNNQSISGTDRPAILEGIAGVMERPEWRLSPSPFCALADRAETSSTTTAKSAASSSSGASDFLAESVYHNVRNIFTQNLLSQMAYVIDKMALRNAAASLVTFCGKTCAYAFCFCPGVADILVRLWDQSLDSMKRVLDEFGISRQDRLDAIADRIVPSFPPMLHFLKLQSLTKTVRSLRRPANPPLGTANLDWYGSWGKRWSGAESDLFYVFVKHFHILVIDFLPADATEKEIVCAPGLLMVHAQILVNLDATVNRHAAPQPSEDPMAGASTVTFDDVLSDPDAAASTLPIPPANATRQMAENRLIMLIRDFLSERNGHLHSARKMFAESFNRCLKAAARKVSIYDNNACYTLCDFLEEAFVIIVRYEQLNLDNQSVLDWPFWLSVCKHMTASHNTATEIKLFAFLYSSWTNLVADPNRKASLCLDFLLEPDFFESRFNHWCPMVRAYFMRLLCWRVARFDGEETVIETNILRVLSDRLRTVWAHYAWLRDEAEELNLPIPSTAPCNPAPARRFLIIRNDNPIVTSNGPFLSFDGEVQSPTRRISTMGSISEDARPTSAQSMDSSDFGDEDTGKKRWSILKSFIGTPKSSSKARSPGPSPKVKSTGVTSTSKNPESTISGGSNAPQSSPPLPAPKFYCFRFSLEWVDKRYQTFQNMRLAPPRLPLAAQMLLQMRGINNGPVQKLKPTGASTMSSRYAGRALAEWTLISHECQNFFDRRKGEGVPSNRQVETPTLAVEAFRRPG